MTKGLEIINLYEDSNYLNTFHPNFMKDLQIVKKDLQRLEAIDNAESSEALKCVDKLEQVIEEITISNADLRNTLKASVSLAIIKQALLEAQEQEKENIDYGSARERWKIICQMINRMFGFNIEEKWSDDDKVITQALTKAQENEQENEILKEIIKSLFDRGCPLHQYTDKDFGLTIEVDDECSIMHLGKFKGVDLDKKLKEVLE